MSTQLKLRDGRAVLVTDDTVAEAARNMEAGDGTLKEVEVNGKRVNALRLVAVAAGTTADELQPVDAYRVLETLGFKFVGTRQPLEDSVKRGQGQYVATAVPVDAEEAGGDEIDLTPAVAQQLQRHRGEWVAVHKGTVLRTAIDLHTLRRELDGAPATIVYVPTKTLRSTDLSKWSFDSNRDGLKYGRDPLSL